MNKKEQIAEALGQGLTSIIVDSTNPGVRLPEHLLGFPGVLLNLSWKFQKPMELTEEGISAVLSFFGNDFAVEIPYTSIFYIKPQNAEGTSYYEDSPFNTLPHSIPKQTHLLN